ncbi:hypothetical protein V6N11_081578 [Hibiscus sabdariffa]|uniref:Transmembrane protein n=1 Tax=Hibiscus sabdariffa TaxID=183260 RepID=A0ABR1ZQE5_9ROSI
MSGDGWLGMVEIRMMEAGFFGSGGNSLGMNGGYGSMGCCWVLLLRVARLGCSLGTWWGLWLRCLTMVVWLSVEGGGSMKLKMVMGVVFDCGISFRWPMDQ